MNNKYVNRSKISERKFRELLRFFSVDLTATQISDLTGLNRNTVNRYLTEIRSKIARYCMASSPLDDLNKIYVTESRNSVQIILLHEYHRRVYTSLYFTESVEKAMENKIFHDSGYDLLIDYEKGLHHYIGKENINSIEYRNKINRIESFWSTAKSRMAKFKGLHSSTLNLHLKESEFRFNNRGQDLYKLLLKIIRKDPLF